LDSCKSNFIPFSGSTMSDQYKSYNDLLKELEDLKLENASLKSQNKQDITDSKHVAENLNFEQYLMHALMDNIPIQIYFKDLESRFIRIDKGSAQSFGLSDPRMAIGKTDFDFFTHEHAQQAFDDEQNIIRTGQPVSKVEKETWTDHADTWVSTTKMPLYDKDHKIIGTFGISVDITENRKASQELKSKNRDLEKLNSEKDKLFSIIAHDLRSPFQGLLGLSQTLATHDMPASEIKEYSTMLHGSAVNLYSLLENLLEWAQFQKGSISYSPKSLSLYSLFSINIDSINQRALQKGINIFNEIPADLEVYADEKMINSVLRNILSNAVKFTGKGGTVTGKARMIDRGMIEILITDTGIGIPDSINAKLFNLGERMGRPGTDNEPSTGLGLVLCKEFVEKHGGKIWVLSQENIGTTFYITLPSVNKL
jgi:PAS domain S-box-containing protein